MLKQLKPVIYLICFTTVISCRNDNVQDLVPATACVTGDSLISYNKQILPIFTSKCASPSCHSGSSPEGNLNLEVSVAYTQLNKKGKGYLDTLNPGNSVLYSTLVSVSAPMPPTGKLDDCTLALIKNWMKQGAKNN